MFEIANCQSETKKALFGKLEEIDYQLLSLDVLSAKIRSKLIENKVLTEKSLADCSHIAVATANDLDYILSWNFKHFVKDKTREGLDKICKKMKLKSIDILSPSDFLLLYKRGESDA